MTPNFVAIFAATIASYILGSLWYLALGKPWRAALGWVETGKPYRPPVAGLVVAFIAQFAMAFALSGFLVHMGGASLRTGLISGALIWIGFVLPSLATNVTFQQRNPLLIAIDGGHWLLILLVIGAVLGLFG